MKNLFIIFSFLLLFSCTEKDQVTPPVTQDESTFTAQRSSCDIQKANDYLTGGSEKAWLVFYKEASGSYVVHPFIDSINGTRYVFTKTSDSTGLVKEYKSNDTTQLFNFGTYKMVDCGDALLVNTLIFKDDFRITVTKLNPEKFETVIDAPIGPDGSIIRIFGTSRPL